VLPEYTGTIFGNDIYIFSVGRRKHYRPFLKKPHLLNCYPLHFRCRFRKILLNQITVFWSSLCCGSICPLLAQYSPSVPLSMIIHIAGRYLSVKAGHAPAATNIRLKHTMFTALMCRRLGFLDSGVCAQLIILRELREAKTDVTNLYEITFL